MASGVKSQFIVLHRYPFSESSFIVKALSADYGLVSFLVKGARRKESPFRVSLDPLAIAEIEYLPSLRRELQIPREAFLVNYHSHLRSNLESLAMAQTMAEISLRLSQPGIHFQEEYSLLKDAMALLNGESSSTENRFAHIPIPFLLVHWLWKMSEALGFGMRLDECLECHQPLAQAPADLWPAFGGGVCTHCLGIRHASWSNEFLQQIYLYATQNQFVEPASRLEHFLIHFLRIHIGHSLDIHSLEWLDTLRGTSNQGESNAQQK